jgi:hypothetical protein
LSLRVKQNNLVFSNKIAPVETTSQRQTKQPVVIVIAGFGI